MNLSGLGEDASRQTAAAKRKAEEVQNNHSEGGELFDLNSLPPGYRFNPTDAEIIVSYLRKKIDHQSLPPNKIIEADLYAYDPNELAARYEPSGNDEWFYFTPRDRKYPNGQRPKRSVGGDGYWKATGADKEIIFEDRTVGYRKPLVFHRGSFQNGVKTNWIMHEFRVAKPPEPPRRSGVNHMRLDDCVLCRVYRKDNRIYKRSRHESRLDESGPSSSKIPILNPNPNEANNRYNNIQMPLQTQQPQPITEILQTPQEHDHFALQSNTQFSIVEPSVFMPPPTPHQSIHCNGNEFGGQGLDNFDIMNGAFGSSFDGTNNIDFCNIPDWDATFDFGDLDPTFDFGNVPGFDSTDYGNSASYPMNDYGNDAAPASSNMNGN
ncbi:NAC domain-containing protein 2-like [Vitis riparia]|uniref:NAC domain-containing protein 2-like n=1 Tax=Vitis riparia TaxID=96939 RepID=UPI00155B2DC4|nr:NAC domain-containing protein 2-like [Vitis riparia]